MASAMIHMVVAKKVNEVLKVDERPFMLGAIAPDIAKMVGSNRKVSHFCAPDTNVPNMRLFLSKYKDELDKPFELGYYVHLVTDVLWFREFLNNFVIGNHIRDKEGNLIKVADDEACQMIYNDYTNLNEQLLDEYNLDLSLFYEPFDLPESHIKELPTVYLGALIDKMGIICSNTTNYSFLFDIEEVSHFIEYAVTYCLDEIKKNGIRDI